MGPNFAKGLIKKDQEWPMHFKVIGCVDYLFGAPPNITRQASSMMSTVLRALRRGRGLSTVPSFSTRRSMHRSPSLRLMLECGQVLTPPWRTKDGTTNSRALRRACGQFPSSRHFRRSQSGDMSNPLGQGGAPGLEKHPREKGRVAPVFKQRTRLAHEERPIKTSGLPHS
jgi:hypothetical protein